MHAGWQQLANKFAGAVCNADRTFADQDSSDASPRPRKRGHPKGTYGSSCVRAAVRQAREAEAAVSTAKASSANKLQLVARAHTPVDMFQLLRVGSVVQRQLFLYAKKQIPQQSLSEQNPADDLLLQGRRPLTSLSTLAQQAQTSTCNMSRTAPRVAAVLQLTSGYMWATLCAKVQDLISNNGWQGVLLGVSRMYDETPLKLRVSEDQPKTDALPEVATATGVASKLLQTQFGIFCLLREPGTGRFLHLCGRLPASLRVLEKNNACSAQSCQLEMIEKVAGLEKLHPLFNLKASLVFTDRAAAKIAAEKLIQESGADCGKPWVVSHTFCDVHRIAQAERSATSLVQSHLLGLISATLTTNMSGSVANLRRHLCDLIRERLEVRIGLPTCQDYREHVYNLVLSDVSTAYTSQGDNSRQSNIKRLRQKQKLILSTFVNGDLTDAESIQHYTMHERPFEDVLQDFYTCCPGVAP